MLTPTNLIPEETNVRTLTALDSSLAATQSPRRHASTPRRDVSCPAVEKRGTDSTPRAHQEEMFFIRLQTSVQQTSALSSRRK